MRPLAPIYVEAAMDTFISFKPVLHLFAVGGFRNTAAYNCQRYFVVPCVQISHTSLGIQIGTWQY